MQTGCQSEHLPGHVHSLLAKRFSHLIFKVDLSTKNIRPLVPLTPHVPLYPSHPCRCKGKCELGFCVPTIGHKKFKQLRLHNVVLRCPHHLQVESPADLHSQNSKWHS